MSEMKNTLDRIKSRLDIAQSLLKDYLNYIIAMTYF